MIRALRAYVRVIDGLNRRIGRAVMYGLFVLLGVLLWSIWSKTTPQPALWTLETAQFAMVAYYVLGGPYALQMGSHVRMDLFYGNWTPRRKAQVDAVTVLFLIFFLGVLVWGGVASTAYSLGHFGSEPAGFLAGLAGAFVTGGPEAAAAELGHLERSATAWRPYIWPIKAIMLLGFALMLLQAVSELCKDILTLRGETP